ncbi:MAG TPA: hypothetical protein V6D07_16605 [Trichocoleus sp.]
MMTTSLLEGLQIIAVVTAMTIVVCPVLLWVLPNRIHHPEETGTV